MTGPLLTPALLEEWWRYAHSPAAGWHIGHAHAYFGGANQSIHFRDQVAARMLFAMAGRHIEEAAHFEQGVGVMSVDDIVRWAEDRS